jgi:hypothetical protein
MQYSRRLFHSLILSSALRAQPKRVQAIAATLPISEQPLNKPYLAAIPLLPDGRFEDVFDPEVQQQIRATCAERVKRFKESAHVVAYVWTAIPEWNRAWVQWFRTQHADSPGKQQYIQFLKETYSYSIGDVNKAYGIDSTSFTDLGQLSWTAIDHKDDDVFQGWIAQVLFRTAAEAIRKADPNHPIAGQKFKEGTPKSVIEACAAVADARF